MRKRLRSVTNAVTTRKGIWITLGAWIIVAVLLLLLAPNSSDFKVSSLDTLPEHTEAAIAQEKAGDYFEGSDGIPALLVFDGQEAQIQLPDVFAFLSSINQLQLPEIKEMIPLSELPPPALETFISEDEQAMFVPLIFQADLDTKDIKAAFDEIYEQANTYADFTLYITGPAGIAVDTSALFSRADIVLLFSTVGIILVLLILTYRSPLLALIPLLAAGIVYVIANGLLGFLGKFGVPLASQSVSIMMILLFAVVIDYSLFIFSRFREELKVESDKYAAMKETMKNLGTPLFYSAATVLGAMLILLFAQFGDYRNFAPIFGLAVFVVMIAAVTLIPTLFTLFGRTAFWPTIPRVGDTHIKKGSLWSKIARFVTGKPIVSLCVMLLFLVVSASNILNIEYEFDTMKSFPDDMPSRVGYEILEEKFERGVLAPTTVIYEGNGIIEEGDEQRISEELEKQPLVNSVQVSDRTDDDTVVSYTLTFAQGPYDTETLDAFEKMRDQANDIVETSEIGGVLHFSGETAASVDNRNVNNRDLIVIVIAETILIFSMLIFLTRSLKMPLFMMGTILASYLAALGLGLFLTNLFFDIDSVSNRVPVYSFIFLVALGIDYNIFLVSRYVEEKKKYPIKKAMEVALSHTGGVISSAGIVLAATFAVLMTQPVEVLFTFGFIVAIGILLDTFLVRGVLLPSLLVLFDRKEEEKEGTNKK